MNTSFPSADEIRAKLLPLGTGQMRKLALRSGVPFTTLWKVRAGETLNPGVETVRKFMPFIADAANAEAPPIAPAAPEQPQAEAA